TIPGRQEEQSLKGRRRRHEFSCVDVLMLSVPVKYGKLWDLCHVSGLAPCICICLCLRKYAFIRIMFLLRILLFPFAVVYDIITRVRNHLYDTGMKPSTQFDLPVIAVGNLALG